MFRNDSNQFNLHLDCVEILQFFKHIFNDSVSLSFSLFRMLFAVSFFLSFFFSIFIAHFIELFDSFHEFFFFCDIFSLSPSLFLLFDVLFSV